MTMDVVGHVLSCEYLLENIFNLLPAVSLNCCCQVSKFWCFVAVRVKEHNGTKWPVHVFSSYDRGCRRYLLEKQKEEFCLANWKRRLGRGIYQSPIEPAFIVVFVCGFDSEHSFIKNIVKQIIPSACDWVVIPVPMVICRPAGSETYYQIDAFGSSRDYGGEGIRSYRAAVSVLMVARWSLLLNLQSCLLTSVIDTDKPAHHDVFANASLAFVFLPTDNGPWWRGMAHGKRYKPIKKDVLSIGLYISEVASNTTKFKHRGLCLAFHGSNFLKVACFNSNHHLPQIRRSSDVRHVEANPNRYQLSMDKILLWKKENVDNKYWKPFLILVGMCASRAARPFYEQHHVESRILAEAFPGIPVFGAMSNGGEFFNNHARTFEDNAQFYSTVFAVLCTS